MHHRNFDPESAACIGECSQQDDAWTLQVRCLYAEYACFNTGRDLVEMPTTISSVGP